MGKPPFPTPNTVLPSYLRTRNTQCTASNRSPDNFSGNNPPLSQKESVGRTKISRTEKKHYMFADWRV